MGMANPTILPPWLVIGDARVRTDQIVKYAQEQSIDSQGKIENTSTSPKSENQSTKSCDV